ncbi:glycosyltransferase family protein [Enterococcus casseliflavus]|uniref:hypothetical protein n=1 Tax=Enterococcus casseliflavus TaxID=37734 RepID=UPI001CD705F8|nr:hypothetical protein [Enterococcus casseliflavus]
MIFIYSSKVTPQLIHQILVTKQILKNENYCSQQNICSEINGVENLTFFKAIYKSDYVLVFNIIDLLKISLLRFFFRYKIIFRIRGLLPEEHEYKRGKNYKNIILNYIEKISFKKADFYLFLNENQKDFYEKKFLKFFKNSVIFPNVLIDKVTSYDYIKVNNNKITFAYSGGISEWQYFDEILSFFKKFSRKNSELEVRLKIFTFERNFNLVAQKLKENNISEICEYSYVEQDKLVASLSKCDIGIIFRDNHVINQTSSPFKIADYAASGLSVLTTESLKNQTELLIPSPYVFDLNFYELKNELYDNVIQKIMDNLHYIKDNDRTKIINNNYQNSFYNYNYKPLEDFFERSK